MARILVALPASAVVASMLWLPHPSMAAEIDADAALALVRSNGCLVCHSVDKQKVGPSFTQTAAKLKGQASAEDAIYLHLTTGPTIRIEGSEERHRIIKPKNEAATRNLARWILSH